MPIEYNSDSTLMGKKYTEALLQSICTSIYSRAESTLLECVHLFHVFFCSSEDGDHKMDEAEEVRSGDEEGVEPEEEPEGTATFCLFQ